MVRQGGWRQLTKPTGGEVSVPCVKDRVEHGLVEKAVAHPLGDDDVDLLDGQDDILNLSVQQSGDPVSHGKERLRLDNRT